MIIAALAVFTTANAQTQEKWYGSKEGGFAITFNANPVLNYVGNMFNGNTNNELKAFDGIDGNDMFGGTTITGKYFLKDNLALDLGFGFNNSYKVTNNFDGADLDKLVDYSRATTTQFQLKAGLEYRLQPGKRIQPIFGADVIFAHTNRWDYTATTEGDKVTTYSSRPVNALGLMLNVGVEYFIIPQISLGANLNFAVSKAWTKRVQDNDPEDSANKNYSQLKFKDTYLKTGNYGANVTLNFYF